MPPPRRAVVERARLAEVAEICGLLQAIRKDPALRLLPVILLSARAGEEATSEGLSAGANDYVVKPFSARELLVRVSAALAVADAAREAYAIEEAARP